MRAFGVYVLDSYAYVACERNGLTIIDISNKTNPIKKEIKIMDKVEVKMKNGKEK